MRNLLTKSKLATVVALVLISGLSTAQTALAQTTVFAHQGKLEFDGVPANGDYDFQFKLFDAPVDGAQKGSTLDHLNITVTNGAYTVNLDFGAAVFNGADRFIEVGVRPAGIGSYSILTPRQFVTSTPYSIRSHRATTANGLSAACAGCVTSSQIQSVQGSQLTGNVAGSQISGTIPVISVPAGSFSYIQNATSQQPFSNFNIGGSGTAAGTLSGNVVNATTQYNLNGNRVLILDTSRQNLFVGLNAGIATTTGPFNAFFGAFVGENNTTGSSNAFFGQSAGQSNTSGNINAFFGNLAGTSNTSGFLNSFFGPSAGFSNTTSTDNSFFGYRAGYSNTTASGNAFFGSDAGRFNTTGTNNAFFGRTAGVATTTASDNAFFGAGAGGANTTGESNAFFGRSAGFLNTTGSRNVFVGFSSGYDTSNPTGHNNTLLGYSTKLDSGVSNSTAIGSGARATASNTIVLGTSQEIVTVPGKLQVETLGNAGTQHLCLNTSNRLAPCSSSLRYKTDLRPFPGGLSIIDRLQPVTFTWKDGGMRDVGFGAEDVQKIEPLLVTYNAEGLVEGVKYDRITVALVNAVKEQQTQIAELKAIRRENAELKAQFADLLARFRQLEKTRTGRQ